MEVWTCCLQVLPKLQDLEVINFGDCLLRTGGAKAIAEALKEGQAKLTVCSRLEHFTLWALC